MKKISTLLAAISLSSTPAFAADWTGFYAGGELGYANLGASVFGFSASSDEFIGGVIAGYDYDLGTWAIGGGIDYDWTDGAEIFRLKARAGAKIGEGLVYGTVGYANLDADGAGDEDGYVIGAGYEHQISNNFSVGGEVLYHEFNNFGGTPIDVDATTVQIRGAFRF